jgi:hypothetical protein
VSAFQCEAYGAGFSIFPAKGPSQPVQTSTSPL